WPRSLVAAAVLLLLAGGAVLLAQIIIRIKDREGKTIAELNVPEGHQVEVIRDGKKPAPPGVKKAKPPKVVVKPGPVPALEAGAPLSPMALVALPAALAGVQAWSIELRQPRGFIQAIAYRPDGEVVATAGDDRLIRLWEASSGRLVRVLVGH